MRAIKCDHCRKVFDERLFNGYEYRRISISLFDDTGEGHYCQECWILIQTDLRSVKA